MMRSLRFNFRSFTASSLISSVAGPRLVPVIAAAIVTTTVLAPAAAFGQDGLEPLQGQETIYPMQVIVPFPSGFGLGKATDSSGSLGVNRTVVSAGLTTLEEQDRPAQSIVDDLYLNFEDSRGVCIGLNQDTGMTVVKNCSQVPQKVKILGILTGVNQMANGNSSAGGSFNLGLGRQRNASSQDGKAGPTASIGVSINLGTSRSEVQQIQIPFNLLNVLLDLKLIEYAQVTIPAEKAYLLEHLLTIELTEQEQARCKKRYGAEFCRTLQDAIAQQQYRIAEYVLILSDLLDDPEKLAELGLKIPSSTNPEADGIEEQMILAAALLKFDEDFKNTQYTLAKYQDRLDEARQTPISEGYKFWLTEMVKLAEQKRLQNPVE